MKNPFSLLFLLLLSLQSMAATGSIPATPSGSYLWNSSRGAVNVSYSAAVLSVCTPGMDLLGNGFYIADGTSDQPNPPSASSVNVNCKGVASTGAVWYQFKGTVTRQGPVYTCPDYYNLNGTMCDPIKCPAKSGGYVWMASPVGGSSLESSTYCDNGCMAGLNAPSGSNNPGFSYTNGKQRLQKYEVIYPGAECSSGAALPVATTPTTTPPEPPKRPECAAGEGVLTSSTGQIHCVPSGTPASAPPIVKKEASTKTNPDGTKQVDEVTTTRDSQTGVEEKTTKSTGYTAGGQSTGTTTTTSSSGTTTGGNPDKPGDSDFCQKNPNLDICTGKLNKEETQVKIKDSLSAESFDPATHLPSTLDVSADARQKADHGKDVVIGDLNKFGTASDPSAGFFQSFKDQMGYSGWFGDIPVTGCTPFSARIGPYTWNFDHCEKALKIADIFGYCLWVMLAFGMFSLATRNRS